MKMKKRNYTLIELIITMGLISIVAAMLLGVVGLCIGGCYAYSSIKEDGLKGTAEQIWEGDKKEKEEL